MAAALRPAAGVVPMAHRVLVIEDEPGARDGLGSLLTEDGFEVLTAPSGESGVACAGEFQPDLVVCDFALPGMDGLQVLRRLREMPRRIFFIILTAGCGSDEVERALRSEADLFLRKPIDLRRLRDVLAGGLTGRPSATGVLN